MRTAIILGFLACVGCASSSSPPPPPPIAPPPALPYTVAPSALWAVTQGSMPRGLANGELIFQTCGTKPDGTNACWDSYIEVPFGYDISRGSKVTFSYEITGIDPVFSHASPGNTCPGPSALSLLLHRAGDSALMAPTYRQFSRMDLAMQLALGTATVAVMLDQGNWINVNGQMFGLADVLANMASVGFVLGGGCFAGHGVSVSSGSATLKIKSYVVE